MSTTTVEARLEHIRHYSKLSYTVTDDNKVAAGLLRDARLDIDFLLAEVDRLKVENKRPHGGLWD